MMRRMWLVSFLAVAAFLMAIVAGMRQYGLPENSSTVKVLDGWWQYETDTGVSGATRLPQALSLPRGTGEIRLSATLPKWRGEAYALHYVSMEQETEVWIDGEIRYSYGASPSASDFVYRSAHNMNQAVLRQEDSGKGITIVYRAPALFLTELGLLREVRIGTLNDLTLYEFRKSVPYFFISLFAVLIALLSFLMLTIYRGMSLKGNACALLLVVAAAVFFNLENPAFWSFFHHSPGLSVLMDWGYYYLDPFVQFASWLLLYASGWRFLEKRGRILAGFLLLYAGTAACSLGGLFNFNLARPFFLTAGFLFTLFLAYGRKKSLKEGEKPSGLSLAALLLLTGYYLDYLKYLLMLLPVSAEWSVFLQLKLPFQFFTGIALFLFPFLLLGSAMGQLAKRESAAQVENATALLQAKYARQQYESVVQRDASLRNLNHDMRFHFRTASAMLSDGRIEEARQYLSGFESVLAGSRHSPWCADYVANLTIGWYADQCLKQKIPFSAEACIPGLKEEAHADLSCILSNAFQNALEGCAGQDEPFVGLTAKPVGADLLIRIENRCKKELERCGGGFATTKPGGGHGIGIASMQAAAKRQNGFLEVGAKDGVFRVNVVLCNVFEEEQNENNH